MLGHHAISEAPISGTSDSSNSRTLAETSRISDVVRSVLQAYRTTGENAALSDLWIASILVPPTFTYKLT